MPAGKQPIGTKAYVFSNANGAQVHRDCMISAHGEQVLFGNTFGRKFTTPTTLSFFAPHGSTLTTSFYNVGQAGTRAGGVVERVAAGQQCYDYNLTKFEGYHTNGLTGCATVDKLIDKCYTGQRGLSYDDLETLVADATVNVDVVTVRNRYFSRDITLSRLIRDLNNAGYNYNEIFCSFCRGPAWVSNAAIANCGVPDHQF